MLFIAICFCISSFYSNFFCISRPYYLKIQSGKFITLLANFENRKQVVNVKGATSCSKDLLCGVPQGSVLGPILHVLYTSQLGDVIRRHGLSCHFYADDTQLYCSFKLHDQAVSVQAIESCLRWLNTVLAVCEFMSFAKSWQEKGCSSQAETWQVKNILMKDFDWQVKFDVFVVSMATWTIEYNLKISLLLSLQKIHSLDFPINLHIAYYH